jgi:hypothetical protein
MFTGAMQAYAAPLTIDAASAEWTAVDGGVNISGLGTNEVRWGIPFNDPNDPNSGLRFDVIGVPTNVGTFTPFALGELTHINFVVEIPTASGATLAIDMTITNGNSDSAMFSFDLDIEETPNVAPCPAFQVSATPCDDRITFPNAIASETITIDGVEFNLALLGFGPTANNISSEFITQEGQESSTTLWAELTSDEDPVITAPADITVECSETGGTSNVPLGDPVVSDFEDAVGDLIVTDNRPVFYPVGFSHFVQWTVEDTDMNTAFDIQTITVEDTTDPELTVPADFMVIANTNGGWSGDIGDATATDVCDSSVDISNNEPAVFPLDATDVTWCATDDFGNVDCVIQTIFVKPLPVDIDIKPASDPNSINVKSNGVVPVAILGSNDIDVTLVDVTSLAFGPSGATPAHDLTDPVVYALHLEDVIVIDGITDLVSHYKQKQTGLSSGDTEACITGTINGGIPFEGCDAVNIK